jgi:hypothetical protein
MKLDDDMTLVHGSLVWDDALASNDDRDRPAMRGEAPAVSAGVLWTRAPGYVLYVASVGAALTDCNTVIYEWLVTNPLVPPRVRHRAVGHLLRVGAMYAEVTGRKFLILGAPKGLAKMAARMGVLRGIHKAELLEGL